MQISVSPMGLTARSRWLALATLLTGNFVVILDLFIVHVAVPDMRSELPASEAQVQLVLASYAASYGICLMNGARLGDMYGRRRTFLFGMALFTGASLGCGLSPTAGVLIAARIAQGMGAALLMPQVLASVRLLFADTDRTRAFAIMGAVQGMAASVSQLLGGWLIEHGPGDLGWRTVFLINLPIGALALIVGRRMLPESTLMRARIDVAGSLAGAAATALMLVPVMFGRDQGWPWWSWCMPLLSVAVWAAFLWHEHRLAKSGGLPMFDVALLHNRPFLAGAFGMFFFYSAISSFFLSLTMLLQGGLHLSPLMAGLIFTPSAVAFFAGSLAGPRLQNYMGERTLFAGLCIFGLGLALAIWVGWTSPDSLAWLVVSLVLNGFGQGMAIPAALGILLGRVTDTQAGVASGLVSTLQALGNSAGITIVGAILFTGLAHLPGAESSSHGIALAQATSYNILATLFSLVLFNCTLNSKRERRDG
ncbi:MFS transporter [Yersinia enterocolitica]|nr:MFS transporter [Yersinia enterocolitica]